MPVRQWVLTVPYRLRYQLAWNHGRSRAVLRRYTRALHDVYARSARECGVPGGRTASVTVVQRAGSGLNVSLHVHTLVLDGVFTEAPGGALAFHPAPAPTDAEVVAALATIRHRVQRLLVRRGLEPADNATGPADRLADESPVLRIPFVHDCSSIARPLTSFSPRDCRMADNRVVGFGASPTGS